MFTSCKDDDGENNPQTNSLLVGVWQYESADVEITINGKDIIDYLVEAFELTEEEAAELAADFEEEIDDFDGIRWTFTNDGKYTLTSSEGNESGTWTLVRTTRN